MRKNVASQVVAFQMLSATDGSDITSGTPTVYYTIDGGTQATGGGTSTHEGNGQWSYVPVQAETNGDHVSFTMVLATAISQTVNVYPVSYDYTDGVRMGMTALPNAAADAAGGLPISDAGGLDMDLISSTYTQTLTAAIEAAVWDAGQSSYVGAGTFGVIASEIASILVDTAEIGAAGAGLTAVPWNASWDAEVQSEVTDALNAYDPPTNTEMVAAFTEVKGATWASGTDTLEAIRDRGDAAWTTGAGGTPPQLLQSTTIATLASQTSFTLTAGSADDDAYNGAVVVVTDQSTSTQKAVGSVSDYTGSTKAVTLSADPGIFTMATGDTIDVIANASTAPSAAAVRAEMDSNSTQLAAIVADTNELQTDWANDGRLDLLLDAVLLDTGTTLPGTLTSIASQITTVDGIVDDILVDTATTVPALISGVDGKVDAVAGDVAVVDGNVGAVSTKVDTAQADLDILTGTDGVTLATSQANYAPATATAMAAAQTDLDTITDTGVAVTSLTSAAIVDVWSTDTLTEAYAADGAAGTAAQLLYMIYSTVAQADATGTTLTTRKLDGTTVAMTYTLDDATTPTSRTRTT